jgi:hypothetical protein
MKRIYFSSKYRPDLKLRLSKAQELFTTRLYDEKNFSVGDSVSLYAKETGALLRTGVVSFISEESFKDFISGARDPKGTSQMYCEYYGRPIRSSDWTKHITITLS